VGEAVPRTRAGDCPSSGAHHFGSLIHHLHRIQGSTDFSQNELNGKGQFVKTCFALFGACMVLRTRLGPNRLAQSVRAGVLDEGCEKRGSLVRVCLVSDDLPPNCGGAPLRTFRHAHRLQTRQGVKSMLIALDRRENGAGLDPLPPYVHPVKLRFRDADAARSPKRPGRLLLHLGELVARLGGLFFRIRREFDLLHVINAASLFNLMTILFAKVLGKPVILEMVSLGADDPLKLNERSTRPEDQLFPHRPLKYSLFLQADAYVSKSNALSDAYRQAGLPSTKLFQIPSGVNAEQFKPPTQPEKHDTRRRLGLHEDKIIILFVGLINERKGVLDLLKALREVVQLHSNVQLLLVGATLMADAAFLQAVQQYIAEWHLAERVHFVNKHVDNVADYMRASDIFCLPTKREGFSMVIIEAMASGLPVVASRLEGVTTGVIRSDREGKLVPEGDASKLADALIELIGAPTLRVRIGRAARERVLSEFTDEIVDAQYLQLYRRVLSNGRAGS